MVRLYNGCKVSCKISGEFIRDAEIFIDTEKRFYVLQNVKPGSSIQIKHGYKYSWVAHHDRKFFDVTDIVVLDHDDELTGMLYDIPVTEEKKSQVKVIIIDGKEYSEHTIKKALQEYVK